MEYWCKKRKKKKDVEILYVLIQNNGDDNSNNYNDENMSYTHGHRAGSLLYANSFHSSSNNFERQVLFVLPPFYSQRKQRQTGGITDPRSYRQLVNGRDGI